jgi:hypothetical protein
MVWGEDDVVPEHPDPLRAPIIMDTRLLQAGRSFYEQPPFRPAVGSPLLVPFVPEPVNAAGEFLGNGWRAGQHWCHTGSMMSSRVLRNTGKPRHDVTSKP